MEKAKTGEKLEKFCTKFDWDGFTVEDIFEEINKLVKVLKSESDISVEDVDFEIIEKGLETLKALTKYIENLDEYYAEAKNYLSIE